MSARSEYSRRAAVLGLAAVLSGCASYQPAPLPTGPAASPTTDELAAAAGRIHSSRLRAASIDLAQPLTPDALALIAVIASPDLKAARAKAGVGRAQAFQAGLLPDPTISLGFDKPIAGPDTFTALAAALGLDLAALIARPLVRADNAAAVEQARLDLAWQEWQVAGQARLLAARINGLGVQFALAAQSQADAETMLSRVLGAAARGDLKADDVAPRRVAAAEAADRARNSEKDLATARGDLNRLLGLDPAVRLVLAPSQPMTISPEPVALSDRALSDRLDLAALRSGYASQDSRLRLAILEQYPRLALTVSGARDTANVRTLGGGVDFTLPLWNRNRGAIAVESATREQLRAEYEQRLGETRADIAALIDNLIILRRQRGEIAGQLGPLGQIAARTQAAARRGDLAEAVADSARQTLVDKQLTLAGLDQAIDEQSVSLELAVGTLHETW